MADLPTLADIKAARERASSVAMETPLVPSTSFSRMAGVEVWLKVEAFQRTGSFKIRGAMNALSLLDDAERARGVVAASAGNHAQGVALAAQTLDIPATVFMPETASIPKIQATRGYGADVQLTGQAIGDAVDAAREFEEKHGAFFVHPYDDPHIIAGQGTLALELMQQIPAPGTVVVPVGGGGLISGIALALAEVSPETRIVGVEAKNVAAYAASRAAGELTVVEAARTVADGIAVSRPSALAFAAIERHVEALVTVADSDITAAVALLLERAKILVEPAGAAALAAILNGEVPGPEPIVAVLSGGNIDLLLLDGLVRHGLESRGRFASFIVQVPDIPGQLRRVVDTIADHGGNVLSVEHHREGLGLPYGMVELRISLATRDRDQFHEILDHLKAFDIEVETAL